MPVRFALIFFLYFIRNNSDRKRFAISVNRKIGNAVVRNYIKRYMKELFRKEGGLLESNHDLWVVIKKRFDRKDRFDIERIFRDALVKINYRQ